MDRQPAPENTSVAEVDGEDALLLEAYLSARVDQAISATESARADLAADPRDFSRIRRVLHSVRDLRAAGEALREQRQLLQLQFAEREAPAYSAEPTAAFRTRQHAKAEAVMARFEGVASKTCIHCGIVLPETSWSCLCGNRFPVAVRTPPVVGVNAPAVAPNRH